LPLERRRFPARVDFVTSRPRPDTEVIVVTGDAILRRPAGGSELELDRVLSETGADQVAARVGWPLRRAESIPAPIGGAW
jgi:hypothetical protein